MKGILVVNEYLNSSKFTDLTKWIYNSAKKHNHNLDIKTNRELMIGLATLDSKEVDYILFWDKDILLASFLEKSGFRVYNRSEAIRLCDDKALTYIELFNKDIAMPYTIVAPLTFSDYGENPNFINDVIEKLGFPMVVKERFGSFGSQVYLAKDKSELDALVTKYGNKGLIFQEFIKSSFGKDIRINVVANEVVTSMYRYSEADFRANVSNGGKMKEYTPNKDEIELALRACMELKLDFAGVDLLFGDNDEPILCEVNSNAHIINIYNCTKVNVADYIFEHISIDCKNDKGKI